MGLQHPDHQFKSGCRLLLNSNQRKVSEKESALRILFFHDNRKFEERAFYRTQSMRENRAMDNILKNLKNNEDSDIVILEYAAGEEDIRLPQVNDYLDMGKQYKQIMFFYESGIKQLTAKLEILRQEFQFCNDRNPIESVKSRIKTQESILRKMEKKCLPLTVSSMMSNIRDIAGVRVICPFITDVYQVARLLISQEDVELVRIKDYIREPKENGYRSLHMIVTVEVRFSDRKRKVPVEIQLRTIAMNFWASTEHQLRYKKDWEFTEEMHRQLKECADIMATADAKMQHLAENLNLSDTEDLYW